MNFFSYHSWPTGLRAILHNRVQKETVVMITATHPWKLQKLSLCSP